MSEQSIYEFVVRDENNADVSLSSYRNQVMLIMNTATECNFTDQYDVLQPLYERYQEKGFVILDFPCNQFGAQAPGTIQEISEYCDMEYALTFPLFNKIDVNGEHASPLFTYLKAQKGFQGFLREHPLTAILEEKNLHLSVDHPDIRWNFTKFLVDRQGTVVERFEPTEPIERIEQKIAELL